MTIAQQHISTILTKKHAAFVKNKNGDINVL